MHNYKLLQQQAEEAKKHVVLAAMQAQSKKIATVFSTPAILPASWLPKPGEDPELDELKQMGATNPFLSVTMKEPPMHMKGAFPASLHHRILVLGDSGSGKTHFAGTMPKPFIADFDNGVKTLVGKDVAARHYTIEQWGQFKQEVQDWRGGAEYGCETFVLDSITTASEAAMTWALKKNNRTNPTVADWGDAIREVKELLGYLTTLPCHVVVTAHNQLVRDEMLGDIQYLPLLYGKDLPHRLGIWFDEVYATTIATTLVGTKQETAYRLQVKPDMRNKIIKSRMNTDGKLFNQFEDPDYQKLLDKTLKEPVA